MKVLLVTTGDAPDAAPVLEDLTGLDPSVTVVGVLGAAGALEMVRAADDFDALFVAPSVSRNETLALIRRVRQDRMRIAVVAVIAPADRAFFDHAMTAGADDVLVVGTVGPVELADTLRRIRQNRHLPPPPGRPYLQVLYAGQDEATWAILSGIPFVRAHRTTAAPDGSVAGRADMLVVDEQPGDAHPLQVVKWMHANVADVRVVALTSPSAGDSAGAALELGADDVVSKSGSYGRRLVASLHRSYLALHRPPAAAASSGTSRDGHVALEAELAAADERIDVLSETAQTATIALTTLRAEYDQLRETQAFERALRDRDREELARVTRALREEQERREVLEHTLNQEEDRAESEVRRLKEDVAKAADRLHQVAHNTQILERRLQHELALRVAERDRLTDNALIGHAVFARDGRLVRCSATFASWLGYENAEAALSAGGQEAFPGTPDHAEVLRRLDLGQPVDRVASTLRRKNGRPLRVLTSAVALPDMHADGTDDAIERLFVDLSGQAEAEQELRLARRLESAGRLAAEMAPEIEGADPERARLLVRQLLTFSRQQARPAGYLSLNDAVARLEPQARRIAGGAIEVRLDLGQVEPVTAGEDDIEQLVLDVVATVAACLPFGGLVTIATSSATDSTFVLNTLFTATAAGYGVLPCVTSPSLVRHAVRCGGTLRTTGEAGRSSALHVTLPC